jgi:hypothetical protein
MTQDAHSHFESCQDELDHPFVMVPTAIIRNPDISPEGRWLLSYLLSHTKNWRISIPYIIKSQKISKNIIYKIINECMESGYLKRETYLEKGKKRFKYFVSREPKFKNILLCPENQDTEKQDLENQDSKVYQSSKEEREDQSKEKKKKEKKERGKPLEPHSADADSLCDFFLSKIKERRPQFIVSNRDKWAKEFDLLLRVDKRDIMETKALILWASEHSWWKTACISPSKLRKDFDAMALQMQSDEQKELVRTNRAFALAFKEKYPKEMKGLTFDAKYAINSSKATEVPFNLPSETFNRALIQMFGGEYVPA